jgi:hypothetical protein
MMIGCWCLPYQSILSKNNKRGQIYDLFDLFSFKADIYDADSVNKVIDTNIDGKRYGIKYLLDWLKVFKLKSITKKLEDMIFSRSNDDTGASEIVIDYHKKSLIICKGVLYVKV